MPAFVQSTKKYKLNLKFAIILRAMRKKSTGEKQAVYWFRAVIMVNQ